MHSGEPDSRLDWRARASVIHREIEAINRESNDCEQSARLDSQKRSKERLQRSHEIAHQMEANIVCARPSLRGTVCA